MKGAVIFDFDGTLIDSRKDVIISLTKSFHEICGIQRAFPSLRIGPPLEDMLRSIDPQLTHQQVAEIISSFRINYRKSGFPNTDFFNGIAILLEGLHKIGCQMFIATNKPLLITIQILKKLGIDYFDDKIMAIDYYPEKRFSKFEMLNELRERFNLYDKKCIFVGDSPGDIHAGKHAGLLTIAVGYGYYQKEELIHSKPDLFIESISELSEFLLTYK